MSNTTVSGSTKPMKKVVAAILAPLLLLGTLLGSFAITSAANAMNGPASTIFANTNSYRASVGVQTLQANSSLTAVAQAWAEQMAINDPTATGAPQHNPNYSSQIPGGYTLAGENVGHGDTNFASIAVSEWSASPGHNANLIEGRYTDLGVGYATSPEGRGFAVQVFASYPDSPTYPGTPGTPTAVNNGDGTVTVSWAAPASTGNTYLSGYNLMAFDPVNGAQVYNLENVNSYTINVERNRTYDFSVQAVNSIGSSDWSADGSIFVEPTVPTIPQVVVDPVNVNDAVATFSVADDGGVPVTGYTVTFGGETVNLTDNTFEMTNLTRATTYNGSVTAVNSVGNSETQPFSFTTQATVPTVPVTPQLTQQGQEAKVNVSWVTPEDDGGSAITHYDVTVNSPEGSNTVQATGNNVTVDVLKGQTYTATVTAVNSIGASEVATSNELLVPYNVTSAPRNVVAELVDEQTIKVNWTAPTDNGGIDPTSYVAAFYANGSEEPAFEMTVGSDALETTADANTGVLPDTTYIVKVHAVNVAGSSPESASEEVIVPRTPTAPDAVQNVMFNTTPSSVSVNWAEPEYNGGAAITGYEVVLLKDGDNVETFTTEPDTFNITYLSLDRATDYQGYVVAKNSKGSSEYVLYNFSTPAEAPNAPENLTKSFTDEGETKLSWDAPTDDGGKAITEYSVEIDNNGEKTTHTVNASNREFLLEGYPFNTELTATVQAKNADTNGTVSEPYTFTTFLTSDAVTNLNASVTSSTAVELTWTAPAKTGDTDITKYVVATYQDEEKVDTQDVTKDATGATVEGLTRATEYTFTVTPVTSTEGAVATSSVVKTLAEAPSAPTNLNLDVDEDNTIYATWEAPEDNGGESVASYKVTLVNTLTSGSNVYTVDDPEVTEFTFENLNRLTEYRVEVQAVNSVGEGNKADKRIRTGAEKPGHPENIKFVHSENPEALTTTVSWSAPTNDGGADVTSYRVAVQHDGKEVAKKTVTSTETTFALDRNKEYAFSVEAMNVKGYSEAATVTETTPVTYPSAVRNLTANPGTDDRASSIEFSWDAPEFNGGCDITEYAISYQNTATEEPLAATRIPATETSFSLDTAPNMNYNFVVEALNCTNTEGNMTTDTNGTSNKVLPGEVVEPSVTVSGKTELTATYDSVASFGGDNTENVTVTVDLFNSEDKKVASETVPYLEDVVFSDLKRNDTYTAVFNANNTVGAGSSQAAQPVELPYTTPESVRNLKATPTEDVEDASAQITWDTPADLGGDEAAEYQVVVTDDADNVVKQVNVTETETLITGLNGNTDYVVTVTVNNKAGTAVSAPLNFTTNIVKPSAPQSVSHEVITSYDEENIASHTAFINWDAPAKNGGENVTQYSVSLTNSVTGETVEKEVVGYNEDTREASFADVRPNTEYVAAVTATNSAGNSTKATHEFKTDIYEPSSARDIKVAFSDLNASMNVSWLKPAYDGGDTLTYEAILKNVETGEEISSGVLTNTSFMFNNFDAVTPYTLTVSAMNSKGSTSTSLDVYTLPVVSDAVENLKLTDASSKTENRVDVSWEAPTFDGGIEVSGYQVNLLDRNGKQIESKFTNDLQESFTTGLAPATVYVVQVAAINAIGISNPVEDTIRTGTLNPTVVRNLTATSSVVDYENVTELTWDAPLSDGGAQITKYDVTVMESDSGKRLNLSSNKTSLTLTKLDPVENHVVTVQAVNKAGDRGEAVSTGFNTTTNAPEPVQNLKAEPDGGTSVALSWDKVQEDGANSKLGIKGYYVTVTKLDSKARAAQTEKFTEQNGFIVRDLEPGASYRIGVTTVNNEVEARSITRTADVKIDPTIPDAPVMKITGVTHDSAKVSWVQEYDGGAPIEKFLVSLYSDNENDEPISKTVAGDVNSVDFTGLNPNTTYAVVMNAFNEAGVGENSYDEFTTLKAPETPGDNTNGNNGGVVNQNGSNQPLDPAVARENGLANTGADWNTLLQSLGLIILSAGALVLVAQRKKGTNVI